MVSHLPCVVLAEVSLLQFASPLQVVRFIWRSALPCLCTVPCLILLSVAFCGSVHVIIHHGHPSAHFLFT